MNTPVRFRLTIAAVMALTAICASAADQTLQKTTVVAAPASAAQTTPPVAQKTPPKQSEQASPQTTAASPASVQAGEPSPKRKKVRRKVRKALPDRADYAARRVVTVAAAGAAPPYVTDNIQEGGIGGVQTVVSRYGENHRVTVSRTLPNIIMTPFVHARATGTAADYDLGSNGSAILITPRSGKTMWLSITDADNPGGVPISLTLVPKKTGSQTIVVSVGAEGAAATAVQHGGGLPQQLAGVLKAIVMQQLPGGYSVRPLNHTFAMANGMSVQPVERYSSHQYDVYRYRLRNRSGGKQVLAEEMFGAHERVAAVAFYPKIILHAGESTDVLIMVGKGGGR